MVKFSFRNILLISMFVLNVTLIVSYKTHEAATRLFLKKILYRAEGDVGASIRYQGVKRTFLMHHARFMNMKSPHPLLIVLHPSESNSYEAVSSLDINHEADRNKFLVVYPDGSGPASSSWFDWNAGNCCGWSRDSHADDSGFI